MERALRSQAVETFQVFKKPGHELRRGVVLQTLQQLFLDCIRTTAVAVLYYSGHGQAGSGDWVFDNEAGDGVETISLEDLQHEYRAAYAIRQRETGRQLCLEPVGAVLVISDCCHSGAWCDRLIQPMRRDCTTPVAAHLILNGLKAKHAGHIKLALEAQREAQLRPEMVGYAHGVYEPPWEVLASCRADELASEYGRYGGHFTSELCRNLKFAHMPDQLEGLPHKMQVVFCRTHSEWFNEQHPHMAPVGNRQRALGWKFTDTTIRRMAGWSCGFPTATLSAHQKVAGCALVLALVSLRSSSSSSGRMRIAKLWQRLPR